MERDNFGFSYGDEPAFEHKAIANDKPDFYHGIPEISEEEKKRIRIAQIRDEVNEIRRVHELEDAAIRGNSIVRASLAATSHVEHEMAMLREMPKENPKDSFISMEYIRLERQLKRFLSTEPEYLKLHRANTQKRNERLAELHEQYQKLMGSKD